MNTQSAIRLFLLSCALSFVWVQAGDAANLLNNPGFESGSTGGWTCWGGKLTAVSGSTEAGSVHGGSCCALMSGRTQTWQGPVQSLVGVLQRGKSYRFSAWIKLQIKTSDAAAITIAQTDASASATRYHGVARATVYGDRWTCLSGVFTLSVKEPLTALNFYIEGPQAGVGFYLDDVTAEEVSDWRELVAERTEQSRKRQMNLAVLASDGRPLSGVDIQVRQVRHQFAFGSAINTNVLTASRTNPYGDFFRNHFEWAVCENESKWYSNEAKQGLVTYDKADRIYAWCQANGITMRGHCLYWEVESNVQSWLKALSEDDLRAAVQSRMESAVTHFQGKFVHWDINNEMVPGHYYKDRLGEAIRIWMFQRAHEIDPNCTLFVNEYNVIEGGYSLDACMQLVQGLLDNGAPVQAIGAQCHFTSGFDRWTIINRFDKLATLGLPIWCTEFDMADPNEYVRANELEDFYRIAFSHPAVQGILMWGFWENSHWRKNCHIVNADWTLNEAGRRYEALLKEWTTNTEGITDPNGVLSFRGFHGTYKITIVPVEGAPATVSVDLPPGDQPAAYRIRLDPSGTVPELE